jgi:aerobic carbon-monoxide dehydrogenase large subunit
VARYAGEPVAVVLADSRYRAEDAAELVSVDYEPLGAVVDPAGALQEARRRFTCKRERTWPRAS